VASINTLRPDCFAAATKAVVVSATKAVLVSATKAVVVSATKAVVVSATKAVVVSATKVNETAVLLKDFPSHVNVLVKQAQANTNETLRTRMHFPWKRHFRA
jgi:hypothetical protein